MACVDAIGCICKLICKHNFVICCGMLPVPPQESLRWKSKWNKGGTAAATGYPTTQSSPAAVQPNSVPVMILEGDAMEVGRPKRSLDAEGEMHDWDLIHAEVLSQLTMEELGCRITYPTTTLRRTQLSKFHLKHVDLCHSGVRHQLMAYQSWWRFHLVHSG